MAGWVIIDGNNLLFAMHAHAPVPAVGRVTMVQIIARWAGRTGSEVTLVFDGAAPRGGLAEQMKMRRVLVQFSAPKTADDVVIDLVQHARDPGNTLVVSSDRAIRYEASRKRCRHMTAEEFVGELFAPEPRKAEAQQKGESEKPEAVAEGEVDEWLDFFGIKEKDVDKDLDDLLG